ADLDVHRHPIALLETPRTHRDHLALGRLLLGGVGDVQPTPHLLRLVARPHHDAILERRHLELALRHCLVSTICWVEQNDPAGTPAWHSLHGSANGRSSYAAPRPSQATTGRWQS